MKLTKLLRDSQMDASLNHKFLEVAVVLVILGKLDIKVVSRLLTLLNKLKPLLESFLETISSPSNQVKTASQ